MYLLFTNNRIKLSSSNKDPTKKYQVCEDWLNEYQSIFEASKWKTKWKPFHVVPTTNRGQRSFDRNTCTYLQDKLVSYLPNDTAMRLLYYGGKSRGGRMNAKDRVERGAGILSSSSNHFRSRSYVFPGDIPYLFQMPGSSSTERGCIDMYLRHPRGWRYGIMERGMKGESQRGEANVKRSRNGFDVVEQPRYFIHFLFSFTNRPRTRPSVPWRGKIQTWLGKQGNSACI